EFEGKSLVRGYNINDLLQDDYRIVYMHCQLVAMTRKGEQISAFQFMKVNKGG
ncbi:hypothetical protein HAX54_012963, partial [Datura stramonium]|nr:hypothetical protein [Datura stramonium]